MVIKFKLKRKLSKEVLTAFGIILILLGKANDSIFDRQEFIINVLFAISLFGERQDDSTIFGCFHDGSSNFRFIDFN